MIRHMIRYLLALTRFFGGGGFDDVDVENREKKRNVKPKPNMNMQKPQMETPFLEIKQSERETSSRSRAADLA